ncbi:CsbD family protein [Chitinimonas viridis]|uniref:CsbD family protein n=1 Tax=Chitinimonas viridis TaxID=664880 RepID=A0ABT8AZU9_9NEIS|nr:CsbD family protein [Chitinimonas viridis]MDN3575507.1 CsbD family protein [Chitinimonas viridis]
MQKPTLPNTGNGSSKGALPPHTGASNKNEPLINQPPQTLREKNSDRETEKQADAPDAPLTKDAQPATKVFSNTPPPLNKDDEDGDPVGQPLQAAETGSDKFKGKWQQFVGQAHTAWGKLTEDELLKSGGQEQKLSALVQERYAIPRGEADKQVKTFIDKCNC